MDINALSTPELVHMQWVTKQELADRQKKISDRYLQLEEKEEKAQKEVHELQQAKENFLEEKEQEFETMKKSQEYLKVKSTEEITELKKEQDHLVFDKAHLWDSCVKLEEAVADVC